MKITTLLIVVFGITCAIVLILYAYQRGKLAARQARELDQQLVQLYCDSIAQGKFTSVWEHYLTENYKKNTSLKDFTKAHKKACTENGILVKREYAKHYKSSNLFSRVKEFQIYYHIEFQHKSIYGAIIINNADSDWKIDGTFIETAGETLSFYIW